MTENKIPKRQGAVLEDNDLPGRVDNLFGSFFLTLVGVIQSVALGYMAVQLHEHSGQIPLLTKLATFSIILVVSYEYSTTGIFRWPPTFLDVAIPFSLGASELWLIEQMATPDGWWLALGWTFFIGSCAYVNSWIHTPREKFSSSELGTLAHKYTQRIFVISFIACIIGFGGSILISDSGCVANSMFYYLVLVVLAFFAVKQTWWMWKLHDVYSFSRR